MTSTPNERIRAARERAGLDVPSIAAVMGLSNEHCWDLEMFEDEAWTTLSLEELMALGKAIGVTGRYILEGEDAKVPEDPMTFAEFAAAIRSSIEKAGVDVDTWGDRAGWDVANLLEDPEQIWQLNPDGLKDIADEAGVDWRRVLPG